MIDTNNGRGKHGKQGEATRANRQDLRVFRKALKEMRRNPSKWYTSGGLSRCLMMGVGADPARAMRLAVADGHVEERNIGPVPEWRWIS